MEPENLRFGGGASGTFLHPFVAVEMVLAIILILCLHRKYAVIPLLFGVFTIPLGQVIVVAGVHFIVLRILILTGLLRWLVSAPSPARLLKGDLKSIDSFTVLWTLTVFFAFCLQWMQTQALIFSLGDLLDRLGGYLVLRFMIQSREDLKRALITFASICVIMGCTMIVEQLTLRNVFGLLGGAPLVPQIREGRIRSQGAFGVYIDAGVFGAVLIPLFVWLWSEGKSRLAAALGIAGATAMTITSSSSTPELAYACGILALCVWSLRKRMRVIRWGFAGIVIGLHLVMKAPVWALIARIDLTGSSSGYHRYILVDNCIRHFWDWWLIGTRFYNTWGWDMWDLSNQFVACAFTGGLVGLAFFVWILSSGFGGVGRARKWVEGNQKEEWFLWCLGAALFATVVAFFGCSYMAQMQMELFTLLSMICVSIFEAKQLLAVSKILPNSSDIRLHSELLHAHEPAGQST